MLPNVLTNALIPMRYHVTLNTLLGISRVTLHITTVRRQLFCMTESLLVDVFDYLTSLGMCHTVDPYVMAGRTTAL